MNENKTDIRVRFAPSPTGYLHVGGYRTALYNYLIAKQSGGKMILRIEDTDRTRLVEDAIENLVQALDWGGVACDEGVYLTAEGKVEQRGEYGPYIQSQRLPIYQEYVQKLLDQKDAYFCFCSKERLDTLRAAQSEQNQTPRYDKKCLSLTEEEIQAKIEAGEEYVVRLNLPADTLIEFDDKVYGHIAFNTNDLDDQVLIKSDGYPTYHFAVVVDDALMHITDVIRGEEWISSTPKHVYLYKTLGIEPPNYTHLPTVLNESKKKLSKRNDDAAMEDFKTKGYLPEALTNFVALLGWSSADETEIMDMDELIERFDASRIHKAGAVFDMEKLNWMNGQYIKKLSNEELAKRCKPYLKEEVDLQKLALIADAVKDKMVTLNDINVLMEPFLRKGAVGEEQQAILAEPDSRVVLQVLQEKLEGTESLTAALAQELIRAVQKETGIKGKGLYMPIRIAFTGQMHGDDLAKTMAAIGRDELLLRLKEELQKKQ